MRNEVKIKRVIHLPIEFRDGDAGQKVLRQLFQHVLYEFENEACAADDTGARCPSNRFQKKSSRDVFCEISQIVMISFPIFTFQYDLEVYVKIITGLIGLRFPQSRVNITNFFGGFLLHYFRNGNSLDRDFIFQNIPRHKPIAVCLNE